MTSYDHSLRPVFTENTVKSLQRGISINLIGPAGNGRERLLHDIRGCHLPDTTVVIINLKSYRQNYDGMIVEMGRQLGIRGKKPRHLTELIEKNNKQNKQILILLHNFDSLLGNPDIDARFDKIFYDCLNSIKNRHQTALLCVTQKPHDQSVVFIDGKDYSNSWLDLKKMPLRALDYKDVEAEIKRRQLSLAPGGISMLIDRVQQSDQPYALLEFISNKIVNREDEAMTEIDRFNKWEKQFQKEDRGRYFSSRGAHTFKQQVKKWAKITGVDQLTRVSSVVKFIRDLFHSHIKKD